MPRILPLIVLIAACFLACGEDPAAENTPKRPAPVTSVDEALDRFQAHYLAKWPDARTESGVMGTVITLAVASKNALREAFGNHPKIFHHGRPTKNVVILLHDVAQSPGSLESLARHFVARGMNVILPLLHGSGLANPLKGQQQLKDEWVADIDAMVTLARGLGQRVSLGGYGTGGTLALHSVLSDREAIDGALFLFAASLDIASQSSALLTSEARGEALVEFIDPASFDAASVNEKIAMVHAGRASARPLVPYGLGGESDAYTVTFIECADALQKLFATLRNHPTNGSSVPKIDLFTPLFVAHCPTDRVAPFRPVQDLVDAQPEASVMLFTVDDVPHESLLRGNEHEAEAASPSSRSRAALLTALDDFVARHLTAP